MTLSQPTLEHIYLNFTAHFSQKFNYSFKIITDGTFIPKKVLPPNHVVRTFQNSNTGRPTLQTTLIKYFMAQKAICLLNKIRVSFTFVVCVKQQFPELGIMSVISTSVMQFHRDVTSQSQNLVRIFKHHKYKQNIPGSKMQSNDANVYTPPFMQNIDMEE